ncbi:MAG: beta-ketoacyl synthase N-terminal-like domain-containing protein, partial [Lysobacteraceae bacterium]
RTLRKLLAHELQLSESEIDDEAQFVDLGLDSIVGVTWVRKINETYGLEIEATKVYSHPTLVQLSRHVKDEAERRGTLPKPKVRAPAAMPSVVMAAEVPATSVPAVYAEMRNIADDDRADDDRDALATVTRTLRKLLAHELQLSESEIDDEAQFVDLGLDSIVGVTWVRKINETYGLEIEATKVYSHPTLVQLSRHVKDEAEGRGTLPKPATARPTVQMQVQERKPAQMDMPQQPLKAASVAGPRATAIPTRTLRGTRMRGAATAAAPATQAAYRPQAIAVVGMAGQFPQATDLDQYWRNLAAGRDCITEVPSGRWDMDRYYQPGAPAVGRTNSRWMGALEQYDLFDPLFFNISPQEAEYMDPQQRLFLQTCWQAIEDAGYDTRSLSGSRCGVFAGCTNGDYQQLSPEQRLTAQGFTGNASSILAARISYFLNLQGPCLSIDTACSSSLVAIAHACDSLSSGASDTALAGGVYVMAGPEMHIKTAQAGMLSTDGRCFAFDQRANGFVPGEGVGAVLLKRLEDAQRDNDVIYGVIEGWGVNQDGKTNGITAPNPQSQTRLQQEVYERFGIDPGAIGLVEAHGTGTKLGDPIEVEALKASFGKYTQRSGYCALGSVKSNIGHCLTAAGIAGFIKLMLSLKHRQQPPTIQFERLNEHIDLAGSPFYINRELKAWDVSAGGRRHAAISAFGFGGTNAHVVVAEPVSIAAPVASPWSGPAIVVLSARTVAQLKQQAQGLVDFIAASSSPLDLGSLAYTLQVGREAMEERLGLVVESIDQLVETLQAYLRDESDVEDLFCGHFRNNRESISLLDQDEQIKATVVDRWIAQKKYAKLADVWVKGLSWDWRKLYPLGVPQKMSLPTYPFAKERYWVDAETSAEFFDGMGGASAAATLHPLLHTNTSTMRQQSYRSRFDGTEFFLADHRVRIGDQGVQKVLPGVAYLEMAREAISQAVFAPGHAEQLELSNVIWIRPLTVQDKQEASIALFARDENAQAGEIIDFSVFSESRDGQNIHCQGEVLLMPVPAPARLDVEYLEAQMTQGRMEGPKLYEALAAMGLNYGPAHQSLTSIALGQRQLLARLSLPASVASSDRRQYVLHPSLMDGALQASVGLMLHGGELPDRPPVPFAMDSARVFAACPRDMIAWLRYSPGAVSGLQTWKLDIDLCDADMNICVQIRGFALRTLDGEGEPAVHARKVALDIAVEGGGIPDEDVADESAFYLRVIDAVMNSEISIEEAAELG